MHKPNKSSLTQRQRFWLEHLNACAQRGLSLRAYAQRHKLSLASLYGARHRLKAHRDTVPAKALVPTRKFLPVQVTTPGARPVLLKVWLRNGIVVEVPEHAEPARCQALLASLAALA